MRGFVRTLRFQIGAALLALVTLFGISSLYALYVLEEQRDHDALLRLAAQLQISMQHLAMQAMNYKENAPRDYPTYYRDLRLYYQDLQGNSERIDRIATAFAAARFPRDLTGLERDLEPRLTPGVRDKAADLDRFWKELQLRLKEKLGPDEAEPRLEWAAEELIAAGTGLTERTDALLGALTERIDKQTRAANLLNRAIMVGAMLISAGILIWFYRRVLKPLEHSVKAFQRVADGEFGYRVEIDDRNEIGLLAQSFNHLSGRLHWLLGLIARLQQGSDLDDTLRFVAESFPRLMPLDWVGILFVTDDGRIQLEKAYSDGTAESLGMIRFPFADTPLEECLQGDQPLHLPDVQQLATLNPEFKFLRFLTVRERRDAIFLPVTDQSPIPGVLVFASRHAHAYRSEHRTLLANLSVLITLSFGRTLKLAEHARLAAIGQFASGIAHEIRNPLATIELALAHFRSADLPPAIVKRADLAHDETQRMGRLLEDMLLYAKPLKLQLQSLSLADLTSELVAKSADYAASLDIGIDAGDMTSAPIVQADHDRLLQVFQNLLRNAVEASPAGAQVVIDHVPDTAVGSVAIRISNTGEAIPEADLHRIYEPFFTTKASGTGLGLSIVRRIVDAHGGSIAAHSNAADGTCFTVALPLPGDDT